MFCTNCGNNCGDANFCSNCGYNLKGTVVTVSTPENAPDEKAEMVCRYEKYKVKGNKIATIGAIRKNTGMSFDEALEIADELLIDEMPPARTWERDKKRRAELNASGQAYCPKCLSTSISANRRGYSLVWGFIGSNKMICTCLKCGHRWKP